MKLSCSFLLLSLAVGVSSPAIMAAPLYPAGDDWMREKIVPPTQTLPLEDALFAVAKASSANILIDAIHLPTAEIKPYAERNRRRADWSENSRLSVVAYVANQGHIDYERSDPDTFVIWPQPDTQKLAVLATKAQKQWYAIDYTSPVERAYILSRISKFFARTAGWNVAPQTDEEQNANAKGIDAIWKLKDSPVDIRDAVRNELARRVLMRQDPTISQRFTADYWKNARLTLETGTEFVNDDNDKYVGRRSRPQLLIVPQPRQKIMLGFPDLREEGPLDSKPFFTSTASTLSAEERKKLIFESLLLSPDTPPFIPTKGVDLKNEGVLQKRVAFAVKRVALTQFVADLKKQSGVTLSVAPDLSPTFKVTGCTSNGGDDANPKPSMTLASAMGALARLYGAHWDKQGTDYVLQSDNLTALQTGLRQLGYKSLYDWYDRATIKESSEHSNHIADEVVKAATETALQSPQGITVAQLPANVQIDVIEYMMSQPAPLLLAQQRLDDVLAQDLRFRFAPLPPGTTNFFGVFGSESFSARPRPLWSAFTAFSADGRYIVDMFPELSAKPAPVRDTRSEDYKKGAEQWLKEHGRQW